MTPTLTTLITLIFAVPISDIPHPDRYTNRFKNTVQVNDIVSPWVGLTWEDNRIEVWIQEQRDSAMYYVTPTTLRRRRPCVPEPSTVLLLGGSWWWVYVNRMRMSRR